MTKTTLQVKRLPQIVQSDPMSRWLIARNGDHYVVEVTHGPSGMLLKKPVTVNVTASWTEADIGLVTHIIESLSKKMPNLIEFALKEPTVYKVLRHLRRSHSGSLGSTFNYTYCLVRFFQWLGQTPNTVYNSLVGPDGTPNRANLKSFKERCEDYVDVLMARDQAPKTIRGKYYPVKTWLEVNDIPKFHIDLPAAHVIYGDRAPTPDELTRWIDVASLRAKVAISSNALGGFRPATLSKLEYRHVKQDFERNITPIHVHVEAGINKGAYCDYDTFLGEEAVHFLKLYLEARKSGNPWVKVSPEVIHDKSPLLRAKGKKPKPMTARGIEMLIRSALLRSGLVKKGPKRCELRPYSLRKYFDTNLASAGVHRDYIDYMLGHKTPTYNSIRSKGIEFLRNIYASSGLSIKPKTQISKIEILKEMVRSLGMNPDEILVKEAFSQPHRTVVGDPRENILRDVLREVLKREFNP